MGVQASELLVSVIVPVRDNAPGIAELIGRLAVQTLPRDRQRACSVFAGEWAPYFPERPLVR